MNPQRLDRVLTCYRIGDPGGAYRIFDATGSTLLPGRWNTEDSPLLYSSEHYATAMLEKLAAGQGSVPENQHFIVITLPNGLSYEVVTKDRLPAWDTRTPTSSRDFGARWIREMRSAILFVPSYVARIERNILINLRHPEATNITASLPEPVWWDERLFR